MRNDDLLTRKSRAFGAWANAVFCLITHASMGRAEDYEQALGCSFVFNSNQNKLVIAKSALAPSLASHRIT